MMKLHKLATCLAFIMSLGCMTSPLKAQVRDYGVYVVDPPITNQEILPGRPLPAVCKTEKTLKVANRDYPVQRIDGLPSRQVTPLPEDLERILEDNAKIADVRAHEIDRPYFLSGFTWPARGPVSGPFGSQRILNGKPRRPHNGVDVAAPRGTSVVAGANGVVVLVHPDMFFTGKTVMIDHGHGLSSVYVHMDDIRVTQGQRVTKGTRIGTVGMTGRVTGPHLHWGVSLFGIHLDPAFLAGPMETPTKAEEGG